MAERHKTQMATQPVTCKACSRPFLRWQTWGHPGSASTRCKPCYDDYVRARTGATKRRENREAEPGFRPNTKQWRALRLRVIDEETNCGICGEVVDKTLKPGSRLAPSVDHINPLSLGGDYWERSNLRLAHHGCNAREGARQWKQMYEAAIEREAALHERITQLEACVYLEAG